MESRWDGSAGQVDYLSVIPGSIWWKKRTYSQICPLTSTCALQHMCAYICITNFQWLETRRLRLYYSLHEFCNMVWISCGNTGSSHWSLKPKCMHILYMVPSFVKSGVLFKWDLGKSRTGKARSLFCLPPCFSQVFHPSVPSLSTLLQLYCRVGTDWQPCSFQVSTSL